MSNNQSDDSHSENIDDSLNEDEKRKQSLVNLDISINNRKKASLIIYEGDKIEQKVNNFCKNYRIAPYYKKMILNKVYEELDTNTNNSLNDTINNDLKNNANKEPKEVQNIIPKFIDFIPEEKRKLDHILNESESLSISESSKEIFINNINQNAIKKNIDNNKLNKNNFIPASNVTKLYAKNIYERKY